MESKPTYEKVLLSSLYLLITVILALLLSSPVLATEIEQQEEIETLNLKQLIDLALKNSPDLAAIKAGVKAAEMKVKQARGGYYPRMDIDAVVGPVNDAEKPYVEVDPGKVTSDGKYIGEIVEETPNDELHGVNIFGRLELTITQPIFTFGKISNRYKAALEGLDAAKTEIDKKRGEIILRVKELYYALVLSNMGSEAADESDDFFSDIQDKVKKLLKLGSTNVTTTDLYRIEAYRAATKQFKSKAERGGRVTYEALKKLIGYSPGRDFKIDATELPTKLPSLKDQEKCIQEALANRPEFIQLKKSLSAKKYMISAKKADLYPSFFLLVKGDFADAPGREEWDDPYIDDKYHSTSIGVVLGGNWHLDWGIGTAEVNKERAEYESLTNTLLMAKRDVAIQVMKYYQDVLEAYEGVQTYEKAAIAARKWIVAAISNFDMGLGTVNDIILAIEKYSENRGEYLSSLYDFNRNLARLSYAIAEYRRGTQQ
ncbi:MAG TPA: TolC family protein [Deltaproteobacteria bacterium]|nr:TolC family protein [Deltaproteobacteria bacterium]